MQAIRKSAVDTHAAPRSAAFDWALDGDDSDDTSVRGEVAEDRLALAIRVIEALGLRPVAAAQGSFPRH